MGDIAQPTPRPAMIGAILQGLQAAQAYYGIDTAKAQQKLLASESAKNEIGLQMEQKKFGMLSDWINGQQPSGSGSPANTSQNSSNDPSDIANKPIPPLIAGDVQPYLNAVETQEKIKQGRSKSKIEQGDVIKGIQTSFNEKTKDLQGQISDYNDVLAGIQSDNKVAQQAALAKFPIVALGVKRMNDSTAATALSQSLGDRLSNYQSEILSGHPSAQAISTLSDATNVLKGSAQDGLNSIRVAHAQGASAYTGIPAKTILQALPTPASNSAPNSIQSPLHQSIQGQSQDLSQGSTQPDVQAYASKHGVSYGQALTIKQRRTGGGNVVGSN